MSEVEEKPRRTYSGALLAVIAITVVGVGGLIWTYTLSGRLTHRKLH